MKPIHALALFALCFLFCCGKPQAPPATAPTQEITEAPAELFSEPVEIESSQHTYHQGTLYFRAPNDEALVPASCRVLTSQNPAEELRSLVGKLGRAPEAGEGLPIWPDAPRLRDAFITDKLAVLDFPQEYLNKLNVGATAEAYMVSSLLQAVFTHFPKIERVHILVQGEVAETFLGHIDIEFPLTRKHVRMRVIQAQPATLTPAQAPEPSPAPPAAPTPTPGTTPVDASTPPTPQPTPPPGP